MGGKSSSHSATVVKPAVAAVKTAQRKYLEQITSKNIPGATVSSEDDEDTPRIDTVAENLKRQAQNVDPREYQFPFENLVFQGGGAKGQSYLGAIKLIEELDWLNQIKRIAGASAGAITVILLAVGCSAEEIEEILQIDLQALLIDHSCGFCSLLPNMMRKYGWNSGKKFMVWFGEILERKTGNKDITFQEVLFTLKLNSTLERYNAGFDNGTCLWKFGLGQSDDGYDFLLVMPFNISPQKQVYDKYDKEVCVVVTNINWMSAEYCHPKTTPDLPLRIATRMSMSAPGWWLSMKDEDSYFERVQSLKDLPKVSEKTERFGTFNNKTLGFIVYGKDEQDLMKYELEKRLDFKMEDIPDTHLARKKKHVWAMQDVVAREHVRVVKSWNAFLKALHEGNVDRNSTISREELQAVLHNEELFTKSNRLCIFGDVDNDTILHFLDANDNGEISFSELIKALCITGVMLQDRLVGYNRREVENLSDYFNLLAGALILNNMRMYVEDKDTVRTVGINTGHIESTDFHLSPEDQKYLGSQGRKATLAFLKQYVVLNNLRKKTDRSTRVKITL